MGHPFDPADDSFGTLLDALAELDSDQDRYAPTDEEIAQAQRLARLEFDVAAARTDDSATVLLAETTVDEIEQWLADAPADEVRARGPMAAPTIDRVVPELTAAGYAPEVEIDVDLDSETAEIAVQLTATRDDPAVLLVRVVDHTGAPHSARVNRYGLATVPNVPLGPFRIHWHRVG